MPDWFAHAGRGLASLRLDRSWSLLVAALSSGWQALVHPSRAGAAFGAAVVVTLMARLASLAMASVRLRSLAGAFGVAAGWVVLGLPEFQFGRLLSPRTPPERLAGAGLLTLAVLLVVPVLPARIRRNFPWLLGGACGWWIAGAGGHGAALLRGLAAAFVLAVACHLASRQVAIPAALPQVPPRRAASGKRRAAAARPVRRVSAPPASSMVSPAWAMIWAASCLAGCLLVAGSDSVWIFAALVLVAATSATLAGAQATDPAIRNSQRPSGPSAAPAAPTLAVACLAAALADGVGLREAPGAGRIAVDLAVLSPFILLFLPASLGQWLTPAWRGRLSPVARLMPRFAVVCGCLALVWVATRL